MRLKPTEVRGLSEIVSADHESAEACASACLEWLAEKRRTEELWAGVATIPIGRDGTVVRKGRGPWSTKRKAEKDAASLCANLRGRNGSFFAVRLTLEDTK